MRDWQAFVRAHLTLADLTPEREARIVREIAAQLEDFYRDAVARGATGEAADAYARAQITDWTKMAADVRRADRPHLRPATERLVSAIEARPGSSRGGLMLAHILRDARYAVRQLIKSPGFTIVAVLTLALGVGATTAIFSVVNGVLLKPLPYPDGDRLVRVHEIVPQYGLFSVAPATFLDWRQQNTVFEHIATYQGASATFIGPSGPERLLGANVSWDAFELLHVSPAMGTAFTAEQDQPGKNTVIVISYGMWQQRFGGDANVVGRSITLNGVPVTILGVMPQDFYFPNRTAEFWRPIAINPANATRGGHFLSVMARLKPGVPLDRAATEMKAISERLAVQYPQASAGESARVVLFQEQIVGAIRPALMTLFGAVGVVVLIACANVANLLLVRASVREKEIAIRTALGAARGRLAAQMLAESLVLAIAGGSLGVLLGYLAIVPIQTLSAGSIPRAADVGIDGAVLALAALATIVTGILFGLAPAWQASRAGVGAVLKEGGRSSSTSGGRWVRSALLVAEVALSIVLLTGAILLLRSFDKLVNVDPGLDPKGVLAFQVSLPATSYKTPETHHAFFQNLVEKLEAQPGIQSATVVQTLPLRGDYVLSFDVRGQAKAKPGEEPSANYRTVGARYFETLSIPLRRGRLFTAQDSTSGQHAAIVDEAFVKKYLSDEDPLGQGIHIGNGVDGYFEVVGVVGNVHYGGLDSTADPTMYVPEGQDDFSTMWVLARTKAGDPAQLAGPVRQTVRDLDPGLPAYSVTTLATVVSDSVAQRRFSMLLLVLFAGVALFLAAVGLYGVVAYTVSQRTREIGLRMAIGAEPGQVMSMIVGGGMKLVLIGVAIGVAGALAFSRFVRTLLFDVAPSDPVSYTLTALLLIVVAAIACYVPARRAMRVDPLIAMQVE
ncbi:MAG TPA: ABC transporter permease [Vicinamibacterales bacterium]|nr:ABC transporter permease [Vicinamibacterales bacterium]